MKTNHNLLNIGFLETCVKWSVAPMQAGAGPSSVSATAALAFLVCYTFSFSKWFNTLLSRIEPNILNQLYLGLKN